MWQEVCRFIYRVEEIMYDIIGDVHGCAAMLAELLKKLGYSENKGSFSHPERKAVFLGDIIDRGREIREALWIVRSMVDAGHALCVMGNHEFNALCFHTEDENCGFLRSHNEKHTDQHKMTLAAFFRYNGEWDSHLEWFRSLPLFLDLKELRLVHACWDEIAIKILRDSIPVGQKIEDDFLRAATDKKVKGPIYRAVEDTLKGKEINLPGDMFFEDKDGHKRREIRVSWFRAPEEDETYRNYAFPRISKESAVFDENIPLALLNDVRPYPKGEVPVFFGHYWLRGNISTQAENACCLDYSAVKGKGGKLVAYRSDGDMEIEPGNYQWVE